ncbi:MAG: alpha-glucan family phosphorylase [Candidatus Omnitrophica bacterium]|nr:alpha-glucan family phosphorylase [Candidatus Omnitrophota bacterium]
MESRVDKQTQNSDYLSEFLSLNQVEGFQENYAQDITADNYFGMPIASIILAENKLKDQAVRRLGYFSMEYGLAPSFYNTFTSVRPLNPDNKIPENTVFSNYRLADYFFDVKVDSLIDLPIYSGGLGVLAGDTVKTMADYKLPALAVGILWRSGYFRQRFWFKHGQVPEKMKWEPKSYPGLIPLKNIIKISLKQETISLRLWKYYVYSYKHDYVIPLVLLDADVEPNREDVRRLTDQLYRSDNNWLKAMQRIILGYGGIAAIKELGYDIDTFHLNEGHAAFAFIEKSRGMSEAEVENLKKHFVYTCHTPVEAGHDRFPSDELRNILSDSDFELAQRLGKDRAGVVNLTLLAMNASSAINAVSKNHQMVMHLQFPKYKEQIQYVTNGVHPYTWISRPFMQVYKSFPAVFKNFEDNPMILAKAEELRSDEGFRKAVWQAHQESKSGLCSLLEKWSLKKDAFTVCWARRIAAYKRPSLVLYDVQRLIEIAKITGPIQLILAGKAHPNDNLGSTFVNEMMDKVDGLSNAYDYLKIVILENYDMYFGKALTSGVDVWLNNPLPPFEASGTSGMKALLNGVVQLSTLDGWVVEAADKGIGRIFGYKNGEGKIGNEMDLHMQEDSIALYQALEELVGLYYKTVHGSKNEVDLTSPWIDYMISCIVASAHFNTYRMLDEYKQLIWKLP